MNTLQPNLQPGQTLGAYQIVGQVGQGGMATVYKAYHSAMDRHVALKVLPPLLAQGPEFSGRFRQEARTIGKLEHPHILAVYDYGESDGLAYLVMRYLDAGTLKERMTQALKLSDIDRYFTQIAGALGYAHEHGVIHRDIKPTNVLIDRQGEAYLTDFGIAKLIESDSHFTKTDTFLGTPQYMSPEQARAEKVDHRSDLYSLGVMLYEMVTGRVPFEAETPLAVAIKHITDPLPPPSTVNPHISPAVERVLLKVLAKEPAQRYQSAAEFVAAWQAALAQDEVKTFGVGQRAGTRPEVGEATAVVSEIPVAVPGPSVVPSVVVLPPVVQVPSVVVPPPVVQVPTVPPPPPPAAVEGRRPPRGLAFAGLAVLLLCGAVVLVWVGVQFGRRNNGNGGARTATATAPFVVADVSATPAPAQGTMLATAMPLPAATGASSAATPTEAAEPITAWISGNSVYALTDVDGAIVTGGAAGLTYWERDGSDIYQFSILDGLVSPVVRDLWQASDTVMYLATDGGLVELNLEDEENEVYTEGLDSYGLTSLLPLPDGRLLAGSAYSEDGGGLNVWDGKVWTRFSDTFPSKNTLNVGENLDSVSTTVEALYWDNRGWLWVGTGFGLARFDGKAWQVYRETDDLQFTNVLDIAQTPDGVLWVATNGGVLRIAVDGTLEMIKARNGVGTSAVLVAQDGTLWFCGGGSITQYAPDRARVVQEASSWDLLGDSVDTAYEDEDGVLWFGSVTRGLLRYDGDTWDVWQIENQPVGVDMYRILAAPDGSLWFWSYAAVDRFDRETETWGEAFPDCCSTNVTAILDDGSAIGLAYQTVVLYRAEGGIIQWGENEGLPAADLSGLVVDRAGRWWVGSYGKGLFVMDHERVIENLTAAENKLPNDVVRSLFVAHDGTIWVGFDGAGVAVFEADGNLRAVYNELPDAPETSYINGFTQDEDGTIWLAAYGGGLYRFVEGAWERVERTDSAYMSAYIERVYVGPDGRLWVLFGGEGAAVYDGEVWESVTVEDGLPTSYLRDVYVTDDGTMWFATNQGAARILP